MLFSAWKLFGVNNVGCTTDIFHFIGFRPLATEIDVRTIGFLHRLRLPNNSGMNFLSDVFGKHELQAKRFFWFVISLWVFFYLSIVFSDVLY